MHKILCIPMHKSVQNYVGEDGEWFIPAQDVDEEDEEGEDGEEGEEVEEERVWFAPGSLARN